MFIVMNIPEEKTVLTKGVFQCCKYSELAIYAK